MFTNSKSKADILPNTNGLVKVKNHTKGYVSYRDPFNRKARRWGRVTVGANAPIVEVALNKADVCRLPTPLPLGVSLIRRKVGAVTRSFITGTANAIQHVTAAAGIS